MTLQDLASLAVIFGALLGAPTLIIGVLEFSRQGAQRRAEHYFELRDRLRNNTALSQMIDLIRVDSPKLRKYPFHAKANLLGIYEELALMMNSGFITKDVAHYMFGYDALICWESRNLWHGLERDSNYWAVLGDFASQMKAIEDSFSFKRRHFRF